MNQVLLELSTLELRVAALEHALGSPPKSKETKEGKELKEKEAKEGKDTKDTKEGKEGKDTKDTKEVETKATTEVKTFEKRVEKRFEKQADKTVAREKIRDFIQQATPEPVAATSNGAVDEQPVEHFISPELRPDLALSALRSEPDVHGSDSGGV
jgi:hypothetical protein